MASPLAAPAQLVPPRPIGRGALPWLALIALTALLLLASELAPWAFKYPAAWVVPLKGWINALMAWLRDDASFGLFTFQELTRAISWLVEQPFRLAHAVLSEGFVAGFGQSAVQLWPPVPWFALIAALAVIAHHAGGRGLAVLVSVCFLYLAVFGQWRTAMVTLSSIVIAVPLGIALGTLLGIAAFRHRRFERAITPFLDLMQTVPVFAYLVPILWFFGFNPVAAMIATIVYAMPPMVRNTVLALQRVPAEVVDFGRMAGCTRRQMTWKVLMPSARPGLMVGVNQVIMLSLNMVIIASMIGAGGLGHEVLAALRRLDFGAGLEAAVAITLLAIALDRLSQAFARRPPAHGVAEPSLLRGHPHLVIALALLLGGWALAALWPAVAVYPAALQLTTGHAVNAGMEWVNIHLFDTIEAIKAWLLLNLMVPLKRLLLGLPWPMVVTALALAGWQLGGWRLAVQTACFGLFIALTGNWLNAVETVYLCGLSVIIACLIGIPIGVWAARDERVHRVAQVVVDTLQTLPAFAYLIPAVMLFRVGDFAAMLAVVAYAIVPVIRYTDHGIRQIEPSLVEAGKATGCTPRQLLRKVQLPLALPEIMLGVNQTIMMALSMLVITALVGTRELGQEVYIALTKADVGRGLVAGVCVACIAMTADRLIAPWAAARKRRLGIG
ncbi:MAG TPA: ABC transporter permease subunit [Geminicoccaceae bacterium]|nr:ABC transporter permease subunit [Geminicoccaceae bacterium]